MKRGEGLQPISQKPIRRPYPAIEEVDESREYPDLQEVDPEAVAEMARGLDATLSAMGGDVSFLDPDSPPATSVVEHPRESHVLKRFGKSGLQTLVGAEITAVGIAIGVQEKIAGLFGIDTPDI